MDHFRRKKISFAFDTKIPSSFQMYHNLISNALRFDSSRFRNIWTPKRCNIYHTILRSNFCIYSWTVEHLFLLVNIITVPPQLGSVTIGDEPANWGEQVSATCNVLKGDSPIKIHWTLNGEPIKHKTHKDISITMSGKKISLLVIDSVSAHHAGEYACIAKNLAGSSSRSAILAVNGTYTSITGVYAFSDFLVHIILLFQSL